MDPENPLTYRCVGQECIRTAVQARRALIGLGFQYLGIVASGTWAPRRGTGSVQVKEGARVLDFEGEYLCLDAKKVMWLSPTPKSELHIAIDFSQPDDDSLTLSEPFILPK